jgi:hypothetical protein
MSKSGADLPVRISRMVLAASSGCAMAALESVQRDSTQMAAMKMAAGQCRRPTGAGRQQIFEGLLGACRTSIWTFVIC